jgi:hypothetical protein
VEQEGRPSPDKTPFQLVNERFIRLQREAAVQVQTEQHLEPIHVHMVWEETCPAWKQQCCLLQTSPRSAGIVHLDSENHHISGALSRLWVWCRQNLFFLRAWLRGALLYLGLTKELPGAQSPGMVPLQLWGWVGLGSVLVDGVCR